jgi:glycosyltransferase involved in cell wall biosynthesis
MGLQIGFVSTYPPMKCGIATFTRDLRDHLVAAPAKASVIALSGVEPDLKYPAEVVHVVSHDNPSSYVSAAGHFQQMGSHVISLQHEYGIFGGPCGSYILHLLRSTTIPVVTTLHTVLASPTPTQRQVLSEVLRLSSRVVVPTPGALSTLQAQFGTPDHKLSVIPHGVADLPFTCPPNRESVPELNGKIVLLTMGLLSPSKGIETAIGALPTILCRFPETVYVVQGITHPKVHRQFGESYRRSLETLTRELGVDSNVMFVNRYLSGDELAALVAAADVYISPHKNQDQTCSGTLAYAISAGKSVISTPYAYAREVLSDGGAFCRMGDADDLAREVIEVLSDDQLRSQRAKKAYLIGRQMVWSKVASEYAALFETVAASTAVEPGCTATRSRLLPQFTVHHLTRLTDDTGIAQHAIFTVSNRSEGFSTDDNARALMLAVEMEAGFPEVSAKLASTYLAFLWHAFNRRSHRMRNFLTYNRQWLEEAGSEECHGRTLWCLGHVVAHSNDPALRGSASQLFLEAVPASLRFTSLRAISFAIIGLVEFLRMNPSQSELASNAADLSDRLAQHYLRCSSPEWPWFEDCVTYFNARLPEALLRFGSAASRKDLIDLGLKSLDWLVSIQTSADGFFDPVGNKGFYRRGETRARFDQQPIEAHATIDACLAALQVTGESRWKESACRAFNWFLGWNALGLPVYDGDSGGCRDGLGEGGLNQNQGAESTLAFLHSLVAILPHYFDADEKASVAG